MRRNLILPVLIGVISILFIGTTAYGILRDNDPYKYFTGFGERIDVSPDDNNIAFSYFVDGKESIYTANLNGKQVEKLTHSKDRRDHSPKYSSDGKKLIYLSEDSEGINTLHMMSLDGKKARQLTDKKSHVTDAIFSHSGETIYFVAVEAEEFKKGEESREGFDLFSIEIEDGLVKKLTNDDHFSMNNLSISPDGKMLYYSDFDGKEERVYSFSIENGQVGSDALVLSTDGQSYYEPRLSPNGKKLAFTAVSEESQESSTFKYELFLMDLETKQAERLTDFQSAVTSPVFFHKKQKIAFLENANWPKEPAEHRMMMIDLTTHELETVELDTPQSEGGHWFIQTTDRAVNSLTLAILYTLLLGLISVYLHYRNRRKIYMPAIISFAIAVLAFIASFAVAAMVNPWYGIGLGMLAARIFGCSLIVLLFVFIFKRFAK
ncbi:hypothetical protein DCC39_07030 [Pueribacillus theae]|uniref:Prolow-density lipoprotein receptor-related protein 1-like beta-propeller domain-containing protein n=1 Tax=Pueribacillus theae TaxID=2171751 RepID=A0A2U1K3U3_9BACI|nr:DPP IV N-terminal domain-containing protein [Pueribacillus theae]PWA12181.1 hypothetical protein DCC39_07030 [Pueribacillus theae]